MTDISALNARFGIPGQLAFKQDAGGLVLVEVANARATAGIALQGAQLLTWSPQGEPPVIWLSPAAKLAPGKSIRGGIPLCWPWFGPHAGNPAFPSHGFARTLPWEIIDSGQRADGATRLRFRLIPGEAQRAWWPYPSELQLHIAVGKALELELATRNIGSAPFTVGTALHAYFAVSDVRQVSLHGLDGCPYIDKLAGSRFERAQHGPKGESQGRDEYKAEGGARKRQSGPFAIGAEVDRIYLEAEADCVIDDPGLKRRIRIEKRGSRSTVVWNPWREKAAALGDMGGNDAYLGMLCVESCNAADDVVTVAPEAEHRLWVRYSVERD